ncbi:unnamed protein product [Adineta ricciae]|uniref:Uncharacterized protein n=1 Tax=Adineta ricciae TaxID=249248 RepID=A0A814EQX9_ADIRI|nr:unnamed protein product [Adineta ricciae]
MQTMNPEQAMYFQNLNDYPQHPNGRFTVNGQDYDSQIPNLYNQPGYYPQMPTVFQPRPMYMNQSYGPHGAFLYPNNLSNAQVPLIRPPNESQNTAPSATPSAAPSVPPNYRMPLFVPSQQTVPSQVYQPAPNQTSIPPYQTTTPIPTTPYFVSNSGQILSPISQPYVYSSQSSQVPEKRKRTPLAIVDPSSNQRVDTSSPSISVSSSVASNEVKKPFSDKKACVSVNGGSVTKTSQVDDHIQNDVDDKSSSGTNQNGVDDDNEQDCSELSEQYEIESSHSDIVSDADNQLTDERLLSSSHVEPPQQTSSSEASEDILPTSTVTDSPQSKRLQYSIQELLSKRSAPLAQKRPTNLKFVREIETGKQKTVDATAQFIRDVRLILNKLTPQNRTILVEQLEKLELDRHERLEGMIDIIFSKAVEEPKYCSMYAELCDSFQKKQITVPNQNGQTTTISFRQVLLSRCQTRFENDYRVDINYDQRKADVDKITDEKLQKEEAENLEEALNKAKRRHFGNILFIGELFKLGMLTESIMYSCMENLLKDKTDEENLECLCRLLRTVGKTFDEKPANKKAMAKTYHELNDIVQQNQISLRTRFMIQDLLELREAKWIPRMAEAKPVTIDEIHEQDRRKREQEERDRQQRADQYRNNAGGNNNYGSGNPPLYTGSRGSRGSGSKQQSNRQASDRTDKGFNVNSIRQYQSTDKKANAPQLNLKPQGVWGKASTTEKKSEDDQANANRTTKPLTTSIPSFRPQNMLFSKAVSNSTQRPPVNGLSRDNEEVNSSNTSMSNSREGSRAVSREQSRNASPDPSTAKRSATSSTENSQAFDEGKTQSRVHALTEEYTENYSDQHDRSVKEAIEDLTDFCTSNTDQQAIIIRELFTNVLEAKPRARKAIGHLLGCAFREKVISNDGFPTGFQMVVEAVPDYIVDIPFIWQYIGEILGAFMGVVESNMMLLKSILQSVPDDKSKQLFQYIIRYASEFSSKPQVQKSWESTGYSLNDLLKSNMVDSSFLNEYNWLSEQKESTSSTTSTSSSIAADPKLVQLFGKEDEECASVTNTNIQTYIQKHMNPASKYYIRNIVLSYLEARLVDRDEKQSIQDFIEKQNMNILCSIIETKPEDEIQAVYAIQNFVTKLGHPSKMAQLLFDKFYDADCVKEETFIQWLEHPDESERDGHDEIVKSTTGFFNWLRNAEPEEEDVKE